MQSGGIVPKGTRVNVFEQIYWVFTILGTLVGIVVIGYMLYNAYKYRDDGTEGEQEERPQLGELPTGGGKGRKLFLSFILSAIVVISLIIWTYGTLLYVENAAAQDQGDDVEMEGDEPLDVIVVGYRFGWDFAYEGGNDTITAGERTWENVTVARELVVPADRTVRLRVTSRDVFHNFGVPQLRAKTDAIPGQMTSTWLEASDAGRSYIAKCYELCGAQHSYMNAEVTTMTSSEFRAWYNETSSTNATAAGI